MLFAISACATESHGLPFADDAAARGERDILRAARLQQFADGDARAARAADDDADVRKALAREFQRVDERRARHDRRAVLVVVKDGNIQLLFEPRLHFKTFRRADVFEVDAAEGGRDHLHGLDDVVRVLPREHDGDGVDAAEFAEEHRPFPP